MVQAPKLRFALVLVEFSGVSGKLAVCFVGNWGHLVIVRNKDKRSRCL